MTGEPSANAGDARLAGLELALRKGDAGKALAAIRDLPGELRQRFDVAAHEADLLGKLGHHEDELDLLRRLIAREPANASLHLSVAHALKTLGRSEEAVAAVRAALATRDDYGKAWWFLADLKTYRFDDAELLAMELLLERSLQPQDRLHLHFAFGRALEQRADFERAFFHYAEGNALGAIGKPPQAMSVTDRVDSSIAAFSPDFFTSRPGFGHASNAPIFIVGLHRAGSTLVEQILGSHSAIEATGELPIVGQLMRTIASDTALAGVSPLEKLVSLGAARARALGAEYLDRAAEYRSTTKPRFVDKMPANWLHLGLIRLILPHATIIDARRHPMAAGFSNFRQNYGAGAAWTYDLEAIGRYYRDYLRHMRHFDRVLPGWVHHLVNERLIEHFEPEVRRLLRHVGVDFEPDCLEFHRSTRPVRSASAEQVRRPVNREGVDQWRAFEPWLGPMKAALGSALEDWQE